MYIDWTYIVLVLPAMLFAMWASSRVNSTFKKYRNTRNSRGLTGAQAARWVLDRNGLSNVPIEHISGSLTDHYDPWQTLCACRMTFTAAPRLSP